MADLITLDEYKQAKAISGAKDDERLILLVPAVSQLVKTYCGNSFVDYTINPYTEYVSVEWDTSVIQLTETPIISVTSVSQRANYEDYVVLAATDYVVNKKTDTIVKKLGNWDKGLSL
jgi:hypothetical protein